MTEWDAHTPRVCEKCKKAQSMPLSTWCVACKDAWLKTFHKAQSAIRNKPIKDELKQLHSALCKRMNEVLRERKDGGAA